MTGGRASRQKGNRTERAVVHVLQSHGLAAERVPLSGAARGRFGGDVSVLALGRDLRGEVKCRGNEFNRLYDWLEGHDFLVIRADRKTLLVVARIELAAETVMAAERAKGGCLMRRPLTYGQASENFSGRKCHEDYSSR
jgi:Holliday junction resolvase